MDISLRLTNCDLFVTVNPFVLLDSWNYDTSSVWITSSVDEMGADCLIGQNVTLGTNARDMEIGDYTLPVTNQYWAIE
jgi:hypothetical protein